MTTVLRHKSTAPSHMHYNSKPKGFKEVRVRNVWWGLDGWEGKEGRRGRGRGFHVVAHDSPLREGGGAGVSMWWRTTQFLP